MKAFIIRKPNDELSEKLSEECYQSAVQFGIEPYKFDGVYSDHDKLIKEKNLRFFEKMKDHRKESTGIKGCFLSHFLLWEKCLELNEPIIIFEHDALMIRPLPEHILDLFTHHCVLDYAVHFENYEEIVNTECQLTVTEFPQIRVDNQKNLGYSNINKNSVRGSHAHIITPLGAETIINSVRKFGILPSDACVNRFYTSYIIVDPLVARCHPFFSNSKNRKQFGHVK
jgi:GR25 family glycosyltransferase involved in LPS biosynthesis